MLVSLCGFGKGPEVSARYTDKTFSGISKKYFIAYTKIEMGLERLVCFQTFATVCLSWNANISNPRNEILDEINLPP
jgi:hypothetical protein